jgi:hypothetical protein
MTKKLKIYSTILKMLGILLKLIRNSPILSIVILYPVFDK